MCVNVHIGGYLALKRIDPQISATLLGLLGRVPPGTESLPQPLLFTNAQTSGRSAMQLDSQQPVSDNSTSQVSHTQRVGTQVNVISGGNSSLNVGSKGDTVADQQATAASKPSPIDIHVPDKVINPSKHESKTYMLNIQIPS